MHLTVRLTVEVPDDELSVNAIERAVTQAASALPRAVWQEAVHRVEALALAQHPPGSMRVKSWESRSLWTSSGPVTFRRRRFLSQADGRTLRLFDLRVGLPDRLRSTPRADALFAESAAEAPYAVAARSWERAWGVAPSPMLIWHATRRVGSAIRAESDRQRRSIFEDGDLPGTDHPAPPFLAVEADSTFLPAWHGKSTDLEVYVGIAYPGKTERRSRPAIEDKGRCFSLRGSAHFGQVLLTMAQTRHNALDSPCGLFLSDGAACLRTISEDHFPRLTRQLDRAHAFSRVREAYGPSHSDQAHEIIAALRKGHRQDACERVSDHARRWRNRTPYLRELRGYLDGPGSDLYGTHSLRTAGIAVPPRMEGTGGIEREIGVLVGQRMKRRGMSWTRRGSENLLAVRQQLLDRLSVA